MTRPLTGISSRREMEGSQETDGRALSVGTAGVPQSCSSGFAGCGRIRDTRLSSQPLMQAELYPSSS